MKTQKQSGYDLSLKHFVTADMSDLNVLKTVQQWAADIEKMTGGKLVITPTRR